MFLVMFVSCNICYKNCHRDRTLKRTFQNVHINFMNSDFSVDNVEGSVSQNVYLGPGHFFMLCRKLRNVFFHCCFTFHIIKLNQDPK